MSAAHSRRAGPALRALAEGDPALAALSLWCRHRDGPGPVARTSGETITYGPGFTALSRPEQVGLAAHHVLHVAFRHSARARAMAARHGPGFQADLFNIAADAIVNDTVLLAGYVLPHPRVTLTRLLAEALDAEAGAEGAIAAWDVERLYHRLTGGGTGGGTRAAEAARKLARAADCGEDLDPAGTGAGDETDAASDWQGRLARALAEGRAAGRGLGRLTGRLGDLPRTDTPWERLLRGAVTRAVTSDALPQPFRPSRRWLAMDAAARASGAPTPGFVAATGRPRLRARIAVLLDTSGSVPRPLRDRFAGEVAGIAGRTGAEVHLIVFDTEVREARTLPGHDTARSLRDLDWPEGGGTDFAPALAAARDARPSIIVVLTDLEADPGKPPGRTPVIWATPRSVATAPSWGRVIALDR